MIRALAYCVGVFLVCILPTACDNGGDEHASESSSSSTFLALGQAAFQQGNYDVAISHFETVIQLDPESADALVGIGSAKARSQDFTGAIDAYSAAIAIEPSARAYEYRGIARIALIRATGDKKSRLDQAFPTSNTPRGNFFRQTTEDLKLARDLYPDRSPESFEAGRLLGLAYLQWGQKDLGCLTLFRSAINDHARAQADLDRYCPQ